METEHTDQIMDTENESQPMEVSLPEPEPSVVSSTIDRNGGITDVVKEQPSPQSASPVPLSVQNTESTQCPVSRRSPLMGYLPDQPTNTPLKPSLVPMAPQMTEQFKSTSQSSDHMFEKFRKWAVSNYGDSGKTKTVTKKKYQRIMRVLSGEEQPTSDNSKFRFWVKNKGFRLGPPPPDEIGADDQVLYVPTRVHVSTNLIFI